MTWYQEIPKVELHVHLEGAIPHTALFELIGKYGGDPSVPTVNSLEKEYRSLEEEGGFTKKEICELILLGIESSWLSSEKKRTLSRDFTGSGLRPP